MSRHRTRIYKLLIKSITNDLLNNKTEREREREREREIERDRQTESAYDAHTFKQYIISYRKRYLPYSISDRNKKTACHIKLMNTVCNMYYCYILYSSL